MKKIMINMLDLKNNIKIIKSKLDSDTKIIAVVKANGMGLGLVEYSKVLIENQIDMLAVANVNEAIKLRQAKISVPILMMTPINDYDNAKELIKNDITLTIDNKFNINLIESIAEELNKEVKVHVKIDTGFARYGFLYNETEQIIKDLSNLNNIKLEGIFTHFSNPKDSKWTNIQYSRFINVIDVLNNNNIKFSIRHCCASTAFLKYPEMRLDAIRIGSVVQGRTLTKVDGLKKIGTCITQINEIKELPKGYNISYTNTYKTKRKTKVAILPIGYMDGFNNGNYRDDFSLKNNLISIGMEIKKLFKDNHLKVYIKNKPYNILGRLGMYHSIVDITDSTDDINIGEDVILDMKPLQADQEIRREYY